jgi:hypothetical protein
VRNFSNFQFSYPDVMGLSSKSTSDRAHPPAQRSGPSVPKTEKPPESFRGDRMLRDEMLREPWLLGRCGFFGFARFFKF